MTDMTERVVHHASIVLPAPKEPIVHGAEVGAAARNSAVGVNRPPTPVDGSVTSVPTWLVNQPINRLFSQILFWQEVVTRLTAHPDFSEIQKDATSEHFAELIVSAWNARKVNQNLRALAEAEAVATSSDATMSGMKTSPKPDKGLIVEDTSVVGGIDADGKPVIVSKTPDGKAPPTVESTDQNEKAD